MYSYFSGYIATPSKIRNFLECPRKYWYMHINRETKNRQPEKPYFTLGHHVHSALDEFFKVQPDLRKEELLIGEFHKAWEKHHGKEAGFATEEEEKLNKDRGVMMLKKFMESEDWHTVPLIVPGDDSFLPGYRSVAVNRDLMFGGIIDRLDEDPDGMLHVIDYKSGKSDAPDDWQLPMYAVLVGKLLNRFVGRTSYIFLEHGKRVTRENSIEDNLEIIKRVQGVVSCIPKSKNKEDFVCKEGENCRHIKYLYEIGYDPQTDTWTQANEMEEEDLGYSKDLPF